MNSEAARGAKLLPVIAASLHLCGWSLAEEPKQSKPLDQIVVIGSMPIDTKVLEKAATPFIRSHSVPMRVSGQIARWKSGICPVTRGLSPAYNDFVTARLRAVAASVGVPVNEKSDCRPNVTIIFTTEPQQLLDEVAHDHEFLLGFHWTAQTKKLATFSRPIQAWYVTTTTDSDGVETMDDQQEIFSGHSPGHGLDFPLLGGTASAIVHALVVADTNKVTGFTIGSISDYVAVLSLSQARSLDECTELPSILDLISSTCGARQKPEAITAVDSAYLRALYRINIRDPLFFQRTEINIHMIKELEGR